MASQTDQGGYRVVQSTSDRGNEAVQPLVSIVTVVRNGATTLEKTIRSVLKYTQNGTAEYLIVDGASNDGTLDILRKYENELAVWCSEPDTGIYQAMNKGWVLCHGHYVYYLGADDILLNLPVPSLTEACARKIDIVYGNVQLSNSVVFKSHYGIGLIYDNTLHHQGLFVNRSRFSQGPFDERYSVFADFDLNQRMYKMRFSAMQVEQTIARFNLAGKSSTVAKEQFYAELLSIVKSNFGGFSARCAYWVIRLKGARRRSQMLLASRMSQI